MTRQNPEAIAHLTKLADLLGVDLQDQHIAVATPRRDAMVQSADGSLEATINASTSTVRITAPRSPGITIRLIDHTNRLDARAPKGAIYEITAHRTERNESYLLNGDICTIYVGPEGLLLDNAAREQAAELSQFPTRGY